MVVKDIILKGYDEFSDFIKSFDSKDKTVYFYFTGSKLPSGESWCSDCVLAWPTVKKEVSLVKDDIQFVIVEVGDRPTWKNSNCPFRKDPLTKLMVIPTLKKWNSPKKLEGDQCSKSELVSMIFENDD